MAVTEQRMSQSNGCHQAMAVTEQWMSQRFGGRSRTKVLFSHLQLSLFEGSLARNAFLRDCTKCRVLQDKTCLGRCVEKLVRRTGARRSRLSSDHGRTGPAVELTVQASFSQLEVLRFELKEVSHESFVFISSTCRF